MKIEERFVEVNEDGVFVGTFYDFETLEEMSKNSELPLNTLGRIKEHRYILTGIKKKQWIQITFSEFENVLRQTSQIAEEPI